MAISSFNKTGEDYSSIAAWEGDTDNDLVTAAEGETLEIYADDGDVTTFPSYVTGATANSTYYRTITSALDDRHVGYMESGKAKLLFSSIAMSFEDNEDYQRITYLLIESSYANHAILLKGANQVFAYNVWDGTGNDRGLKISANGNSNIYRNILYDHTNWNGGLYFIGGDGGARYNTLINCKDGIKSDSGSTLCIGNIVLNSTNDDYSSNMDTTNSGYNIGSDTSAPGSTSLDSRTLTDNTSPGAGDYVIVNETAAGSEDYRLYDNATDNDAQDAGTNLGSPYDVDIAGNTVTGTWDIGAFEVQAGAPADTSLVPRRRIRGALLQF